jgi:hypothetical protein
MRFTEPLDSTVIIRPSVKGARGLRRITGNALVWPTHGPRSPPGRRRSPVKPGIAIDRALSASPRGHIRPGDVGPRWPAATHRFGSVPAPAVPPPSDRPARIPTMDLAYTSLAGIGDGSRSNISATCAHCRSAWTGIPVGADRPLAVHGAVPAGGLA